MIVAGSLDALDALAAELTAADVFHRRLYVDAPYHHAYVDAVERDMREAFGRVGAKAPRTPLYSPLRGGLIAEACRRGLLVGERTTGRELRGRDDQGIERRVRCRARDRTGPRDGRRGQELRRRGQSLCVARHFGRARRVGFVGGAAYAGRHVRGSRSARLVRAATGRLLRTAAELSLAAHASVEGSAGRQGGARAESRRRAPSPTAGRTLACLADDLSSAMFPYLFHHVVAGTALFPGAGHLAVMLAASRALGRGNSLEGVRFERALALTEASSLRIDVDETTGVCTVSARSGQEDAWQRYATGRLALVRAPRTAHVDLNEAWHRRPSHMTAEALYRTLAERDLAYGPLFHSVRGIRFCADDVVASIALPEGLAEAGELHPVLLDGAFQALAAVVPGVVTRGPWVPVSVDEIRLHGVVGPKAWAIARVIDRTPSSFTASLRLFDAAGTVTVEIDGLRCQRLPTAADVDPLARIAFEERWERSTSPPVRRIAMQGWLLVDGQDMAEQLAAELVTYSQQCRIQVGGGLPQPERDFRIDRVVWMSASIDGADAGMASSSRLLDVVQALAKWPVPPRLVMVTRGAFAAPPRADQASVWSLGRVVATEHPELHATLVDCEADEQAAIWLARNWSPTARTGGGTGGRRPPGGTASGVVRSAAGAGDGRRRHHPGDAPSRSRRGPGLARVA